MRIQSGHLSNRDFCFLSIMATCILLGGCAVKGMVSGFETKVNVVGRVIDAADDKPVAGVIVTVTPPNSNKPVTAQTDNLGYFEFQNLTVGKTGGVASGGSSGGLVTVEITHSGYRQSAGKYPIQGFAGVGSAASTTDVGTIKLERSDATSAK